MKTKLTPREREILGLLASGCSQKEIADQIQVSSFTVDVHIKNIKIKTGISKVTELVSLWYVRQYHISIMDIPERLRRIIAAAMVALTLCGLFANVGQMVRVNRVQISRVARTARRNSENDLNDQLCLI